MPPSVCLFKLVSIYIYIHACTAVYVLCVVLCLTTFWYTSPVLSHTAATVACKAANATTFNSSKACTVGQHWVHPKLNKRLTYSILQLTFNKMVSMVLIILLYAGATCISHKWNLTRNLRSHHAQRACSISCLVLTKPKRFPYISTSLRWPPGPSTSKKCPNKFQG